jgi:hypothetical protein
MESDKVITDARARIIWGESSSSVRTFFLSNGISEAVADARIHEFILERNREIRSVGMRSVLIGVLLAGSAGGGLFIWIFYLVSPSVVGMSGRGVISLSVVLGTIASYGLWRLVTGIVYLFRPQSEHKSIADINQDDLLE